MPPQLTEVRAEEVHAETWHVLRIGRLEEVHFSNGSIRFRVQIGDAGRDPFITQWFNDITPAEDFLDRVKQENERFVRE